MVGIFLLCLYRTVAKDSRLSSEEYLLLTFFCFSALLVTGLLRVFSLFFLENFNPTWHFHFEIQLLIVINFSFTFSFKHNYDIFS